jgi:hypothetical protein
MKYPPNKTKTTNINEAIVMTGDKENLTSAPSNMAGKPVMQ